MQLVQCRLQGLRIGLAGEGGAGDAVDLGVTENAWVFLLLARMAAAAAVQGLYERIVDLDSRGARDLSAG